MIFFGQARPLPGRLPKIGWPAGADKLESVAMSLPPLPPPVPDDSKDWTWVNERPCPECGFDAGRIAATEVSSLLRADIADWERILAAHPSEVRARPRPELWSPLEYAGHVRDVFRLYRQRLELMLTVDAPGFANWDQDVTAVEERYDLADPEAVRHDLREAGLALADAFDAVTGEQWGRTGHRSDGATFTVATFATYLVHDPIHHVWDATVNDR